MGKKKPLRWRLFREGHIDLRHFIEVTGASGKRFFKVSFGEVVDIVGLEPSANLDYR